MLRRSIVLPTLAALVGLVVGCSGEVTDAPPMMTEDAGCVVDPRPECFVGDRDAGPPGCGNEEIEGDEVCDDGNTVGGDGCSADCSSNERCGNGFVDVLEGEVCDDSNTMNGDGCSSDCTSDETCGNSIVDLGVGEVCDDGNNVDGDGCSADCQTGAVCGDSVTEGMEVCDDGNTDGGDGCSADCRSDETCGNAILDGGEECDDGNNDPGDGCSATCTQERCGNGLVEGTEQCDDMNSVNGDGCDNDCTFSCELAAECDDMAPCNGAEQCTGNVCVAGTPPPNGTDCGGGMVCRAGLCQSPICGNGIVEAAEQCDDMNSVNGDGCDNDCTFSCTADVDCDDAMFCNGSETCDTSTNVCQAGTAPAEGTSCGGGNFCHGGNCRAPMCGDGFTEGAEQCDDMNSVNGDGCDNDCTFSCSVTADCDDGEPCNGAETCNTTTHVCTDPPDLPNDTSCGGGMICRNGSCTTATCGNGVREGSEDCDDMNSVNGDGCDNDCTFSCTVAADCDDSEPCNGTESCNTTTHVCQNGSPPPAGSSCGVGQVCRSQVCSTVVCGDGFTEGSEQCDDMNSVNGDGCDNDCTFSCTTNGECDDGDACNGSETCNTTTHVCQGGTAPPAGTACDRDMNPGTRDICLMMSCVASSCGDGFTDPGATPPEQCDDMNSVNGDGCDNDCTFSCVLDSDCDDGDICNGMETCTGSNTCAAGSPPANGTLCDADMDPATRDICLMASCVLSQCGDGFLDPMATPPEICDDGNLIAGDGCEPDCTPTGPGPTAFRVVTLDLMDPHFYASIFGCRDLTDNPFLGFSLNGELQTNIDNYTLNYVTVHRPLDLAMSINPMDLVQDANCMAATPLDTCQVAMASTVTMTNANNSPAATTCYMAMAGTTNPSYMQPNVVTGPCFVSDTEDITVAVGGIPIPLSAARIAATYTGGVPPNQLVSGVISGFLSEADARATILPGSLPLVGGDTLYQHLAAGGAPGSSCSSADDRDTYMGTVGFWVYLNFTSNEVDWIGP